MTGAATRRTELLPELLPDATADAYPVRKRHRTGRKVHVIALFAMHWRVVRRGLCDHAVYAAQLDAATSTTSLMKIESLRCSARGTTALPITALSATALPVLLLASLLLLLLLVSPVTRAQGRLPDQTAVARSVVVADTIAERVTACTACHGNQGRAGSDGFYPRIAGKPAGYLYNQLINFREGRRQYPLMIYMVDHLSDAYLREMANYFSGLHPPYAAPQPVTATPAALERGRQLAQVGDKARNLPACSACHGANLTGVVPAIPGLLGLPRDYVSAQFGAWKTGARRATAPDCMAQITRRLTVDDISAVADWLAAQPIPAPPANAAPAAARTAALPLACGSAPA